MKKGVIFDLDGTLWEVIESTFISANIIAKKYKLPDISREIICKVFGLNREEAAELYFPNIEINKSVKLIDEIAEININNLKKNGGNTYPNLKKVLNILIEKYDLYIVSNTAEIEYIKGFLESSDTSKYFKEYIAASRLKISKSEAIKKVISDNNIEKAVYIGDTAKDLEAAKDCKIPFIQALYGFGENLNTKYYINELTELPDVLKIILK